MFDTKTAYQTGASKLSDCVLLTFPKNMHSTETSDADSGTWGVGEKSHAVSSLQLEAHSAQQILALLVDGFLIEEGPDYTHSSLQEYRYRTGRIE